MYYKGTGKKKTSISKVFLKEWDNNIIIINNKKLEKFFPKSYNINIIYKPINLIEDKKNFLIKISTKGGGIMSKIISIMYGISKALIKYNINYKYNLSKNKLLTRDYRKVERKKLGKVKSRKSKQYSKR